MSGNPSRRLRRSLVRQWTAHEAVGQMQQTAGVAAQAIRTTLTAKRMIMELASALHASGLIDLTDKAKFPFIHGELNAESFEFSGSTDSSEGEEDRTADDSTEEVHRGVQPGPVERDGSSDQGGIQPELSESDSIEAAIERRDSV